MKLRMTAYWVPTLPKGVRLISPQVITTAKGDGGWFIVPPSKIDNVRDPDAEFGLEIVEPRKLKENNSWRKIKPKKVIKVPFASNNLPMANATFPNLQKLSIF